MNWRELPGESDLQCCAQPLMLFHYGFHSYLCSSIYCSNTVIVIENELVSFVVFKDPQTLRIPKLWVRCLASFRGPQQDQHSRYRFWFFMMIFKDHKISEFCVCTRLWRVIVWKVDGNGECDFPGCWEVKFHHEDHNLIVDY